MKATRLAKKLRQKVSGKGCIDVEAIAHMLGFEVIVQPFVDVYEVKVGEYIAVAERLSPDWRRWSIAHAIGHRMMHDGNALWLRAHTQLAIPYEREAEEFAYVLLVNEQEATRASMTEAWEIAEHFGVPQEMVRVQGELGV